jgi:predicted Fe-S protein YdhL (DUF1289 family)
MSLTFFVKVETYCINICFTYKREICGICYAADFNEMTHVLGL